jgi:hypothetical protein
MTFSLRLLMLHALTVLTLTVSQVLGLGPNAGIDYWWTDYGGCGSPLSPTPTLAKSSSSASDSHTVGLAGVDGRKMQIGSLWWSNYLYHTDPIR